MLVNYYFRNKNLNQTMLLKKLDNLSEIRLKTT